MESLKKYKIHLKGISPLIMHSDKLCNPLHPMTKKMKELTSLRKKKDEHHLAIARIEWEAGLYYDDELGIYMPSKCLRGCFQCAARKFKLGKATKALNIVQPLGSPLIGFEKITPQKLWEKKNKNDEPMHVFCESVVVNRSRIMRTRPIFPKWEFKLEIYLDIELLSYDQMKQIIETAGFEYGLCELRPEMATGNYGKFTMESLEEI